MAVVVCAAVFLLISVAAALAANPTDKSFGVDGIAEIEAFAELPGGETQVGGIVDLERERDGKLLAAVYGIAKGGHYFAAARIGPDGSLDKSFGEGGFSERVTYSHGHEENRRALQAEAVAQAPNGDVVLAGNWEDEGAYAPALARFTPDGRLVKSFGVGGRVTPRPSYAGKRLTVGEEGGELLHDVAVEPNGTIVGVGKVVTGGNVYFSPRAPKQPAAVVFAYRPDGKVDRGFGKGGRFEIKVPRGSTSTSFSQVKALPSGKLLVSGYVKGQLVLYRLTADGRRDRSFGGGDGKVTVGRQAPEYWESFDRAPFALEPDGRIVLGGASQIKVSSYEEAFDVLVRLLPDGRRDPSFRHGIFIERARVDADEPFPREHVPTYAFEIQGLAVDGDGRAVLTGIELAPYTRGQKEAGYQYLAARRFLLGGRLDRHFGRGGVWATNPPGSQSMGRAAVTEGDGKVVAGGWVQIERGGGNGPGNTAMLLTRYR
jgi:uncharacterized delta-60 repeat protein